MAKQGNRSQQIEGIVEHLNFAKNGEPNGAVLDTGHFVHMKPRAAQALGLQAGQALQVQGRLKASGSDGQQVIEAYIVNGIDVSSGRAAKKTAPAKSAAKPAPAKKAASQKTTAKKTRRAAAR